MLVTPHQADTVPSDSTSSKAPMASVTQNGTSKAAIPSSPGWDRSTWPARPLFPPGPATKQAKKLDLLRGYGVGHVNKLPEAGLLGRGFQCKPCKSYGNTRERMYRQDDMNYRDYVSKELRWNIIALAMEKKHLHERREGIFKQTQKINPIDELK
ncbi:hypothetical protein N7462_000351 [Penicillium macrosclerotiorum]|uniref:uncharacterized protein n=1 Tax=Penicillium macrosclerotiorum TaxID=303699 RepID=UPI0025483C5A|nr:uncharacterized protein N7462_000351 [Penicillium macrosclerotiorum]KAJ5698346.1 hypothetical protein N7462_000351 [Penicillium macrosclerotiorum]